MANLWNDVKKFVKDSASLATERFEEETALWKIHREMVGFTKAADKQKLELGGTVYEMIQANPDVDIKKDEKISSLVKTIEDALANAAAKQKEYNDVKAEAAAKKQTSQTDAEPQVEADPQTIEAPLPATEPEVVPESSEKAEEEKDSKKAQKKAS